MPQRGRESGFSSRVGKKQIAVKKRGGAVIVVSRDFKRDSQA